MIREFEFYHGAALRRLVHENPDWVIKQYGLGAGNAAYVINGKVGLYIKHSTGRLSPWTFTFLREHQNDIQKMHETLGAVFVALVCGSDGIACLSYAELKGALNDVFADAEWIRVARRARQKYSVSGSDGKLKTKIGENEYPAKIITHFQNDTYNNKVLKNTFENSKTNTL